ncbi:hypothetical protein AVL55_05060 [Alteromonas macleodii]|uniref:Sulfotransferase family protein n=1 Tax=Alteromonas macleodii TaxID=28108 RepID=A0A126PXA6_ALTMA|nr:sulfotransferase [Alteromonas macleodii]AMJ97585.1 hypothetical protein AVL55_05060 [Alteromonas macleodii]
MNDHLIKAFSALDSGLRSQSYRKNETFESALHYLNNESIDMPLQVSSDALPPIIIIGGPRTGSTFLSQLLASKLKVGYVSNLMASLYGRPILGAILQKRLLSDRIHQLNVFKSIHGVTSNIEEPHEFGYFWSKYLITNTDSHQPESSSSLPKENFVALNEKLAQIATVFERPCIMKSSLGCFHAKGMLNHTNAVFISLKRNIPNMQGSILKVRKERFGSVEHWWSLKPYGFSRILSLPPEEQVSWQIKQILAAQDMFLLKAPHRTIEVEFEHLIKDSATILETIIQFYEKVTGHRIGYSSFVPEDN